MSRIMGIDLGTTNSAVAVFEKNGPMIVPNNLGERITPSVVGFTKTGEILVGKKAKRGAVMNVGRTVFSVKRHMGTDYRVDIEGRKYTPQEISAMILQKLKSDVEDYFGETVDQAVITVPAYFTDTQRQATKDAGEIAGLKVRRIIDEPTAAALAYGLDKEKDQVLLVYDFGGGTFDVSIIEVMSGVFQVRAIQGETKLGGDDIDRVVMEWLISEFQSQHGIDLKNDPIAVQRLREAAEEAKIELSELRSTQIMIEAVTMSDKGPLSLETTLTREKFEELVGDIIRGTLDPMMKAISDAKMTPEQIDAVLLVGGTTRIPLVQQVVKEKLGKQPSRDISPEEVVAMGAAVQTLTLAPLQGDIKDTLAARYGKEDIVIIHRTPFSLGVGLQNDQFAPLIERNSTYPTEAKDIFTTTRDFQDAISFPIYEGEDTTASENTFLDLLRIESITPAPRGVPRIEVTFKLTADRILECRAEDLATGIEKKITIAATGERLSSDEKERMVKEARERVTGMMQSRLEQSAAEEAAGLAQRAETLANTHSANPLAEDLRTQAGELRTLIDQGDRDAIEDKMDDLLRLLTELEAAG
jgi:molecular chaperone DnaK